MLDKIELLPRLIGEGKPSLEGQFWVNNKLLLNPEVEQYSIDILELFKSLKSDGEYFIITCVCGDHTCAGITNGITVNHIDNTTIRSINYRIKSIEINGELNFDSRVYKRAIRTGVMKFNELLRNNENADIVPTIMGLRKKEFIEIARYLDKEK